MSVFNNLCDIVLAPKLVWSDTDEPGSCKVTSLLEKDLFSVFNFSVKRLKQRLEDCSEITLNLGLDTISAEAPPTTQPPPPKPSDNGQPPVVQTSVRAPAKPAACDESITCDHGEKLGTEIVLDSTIGRVVKMVEEGSPTTIDEAASGTTHTHLVTSEEPTTELLQIDQEPFGAKEVMILFILFFVNYLYFWRNWDHLDHKVIIIRDLFN